MLISCIQTKLRFPYSHFDTSTDDMERRMHCAKMDIDEGFEMMEHAGREGAQLMVTIEGFNGHIGYSDPRFVDHLEPLDGPLIKRFSNVARKYGSYIVAGLFTGRNGKAYNSGVLFGPDGEIKGIYDKTHQPMNHAEIFTSGDSYPIFETDHGRIGILICWDMQYPEAVREMTLGGAQLIAVPTMGWEAMYGYARAFENSMPLAVAMYIPYGRTLWEGCDPSCIVDPTGKILAQASRDRSDMILADIDITKEPEVLYGIGDMLGMNSMRQIRLSQRRPETYKLINEAKPPVMVRYENGE